MDFLNDLDGEGTTLVERRGTKRITFSEDAVARLDEQAERAQAETDVDAWIHSLEDTSVNEIISCHITEQANEFLNVGSIYPMAGVKH